MKEVISQEVIEGFLNGGDDEMYIVGVEYDYPTNTIYKIIQDPEQGKIIKSDTFTPFMWVGDLSGLNFYNNSKFHIFLTFWFGDIFVRNINRGQYSC